MSDAERSNTISYNEQRAIDAVAQDNAQYESLAGSTAGVSPAASPATAEITTERVIAVIEAMGRGISATRPDYEGDPIKRLTLMAKRMRQLTEFDEAIKQVTKVLNDEYDQLKLKGLPDLMSELDMRTFTVEGAGRVQLAGDVYANIPADKKEEAFKWLKENRYESLVQETVNSSTLKAWAKEGMTSGRDIPEELFKVTPFTRASLVKVKGSK